MVSYQDTPCIGNASYSRDACIFEGVEEELMSVHGCTVPFMTFMASVSNDIS